MAGISESFVDAFREFETADLPASGAHKVSKADVRALGGKIENAIGAVQLANAVDVKYATRALMEADTSQADGALALVFADPQVDNNRYYFWSDAESEWTLSETLNPADYLVSEIIANLPEPSLPAISLLTSLTGNAYAVAYGYAAGNTAAQNATALRLAILAANANGGCVVVPGFEAEVGALGSLPTSGTVEMYFTPGAVLKAPGGGLTSASDITLMQVTTSFRATGAVEFRDYRRVVDFDGVAAGAVVMAAGFTFKNCGRVYNYTGSGTRTDFNGAFGCRVNTANTIAFLWVDNFRFETDGSSRVCEFGVVWRSGFDMARVTNVSADGMGRMVLMIGDNEIWEACKNLTINNFVARNVYPRLGTSTENEVHGLLAYGRRIIGNNIQVDTCYDLHSTTHDSEGVYFKAFFATISNVNLRDAGRGDGYLTLKGSIPTSAEMDDPDSLSTSAAVQAFVRLSNITCQSSPGFVTAYGAETGIYSNGTRVELDGFLISGQWDRGISLPGYCRISNGTVRGSANYGVITSALAVDPHGPTISNVTCEGKFGSAGIEYRMGDSSGTVTIPLVELDNCRVVLREGSEAPAGGINIRADKSAGQNTITRVRMKGCSVVSDKTTSNPGAFTASTENGSGANEGIIGALEFVDPAADATHYYVRLSGTVGKVVSVSVRGGSCLNLSNVQFSNPNLAGSMSIQGVAGGATYSTERSGTDTVAAGSTTKTTNMGFNTSRQASILPNALNHITITPGAMGSATKWWITLPGSPDSTFTMNVDVAPGGSGFTYGWRACCRYG